MRFRILNSDPMYDYREANKVTQGIDVAKDTVKWVYNRTFNQETEW